MKLRDLPALCKAIELLGASIELRAKPDLGDQLVPPLRIGEFRAAEDCAQELDGHGISAFLDAESLDKDTNIDHDALECVCASQTHDAERLIANFGDAGEALENILDDAAEGDLKELCFESGE